MRSEQEMLDLIVRGAEMNDEKVSAHLKHMRNLPKDAQELY